MTSWPSRSSSIADAIPTAPPPMTTTRLIGASRRRGGRPGSYLLLQSIKLWPSLGHVLHIRMEGCRLEIHAQRGIGRVFPECHLHRLADLLLCGEVRGAEPL